MSKIAAEAGVVWNPSGATPQEEMHRRARAACKAAEGTTLKDASEGLLSSIASLSLHSSPAHALEECAAAEPASVNRPLAGSTSTIKTAPTPGLSATETSALVSGCNSRSHEQKPGAHVGPFETQSDHSPFARGACWQAPAIRRNPCVILSSRGERVHDSLSLTDEVLQQRTSRSWLTVHDTGDGCWEDPKLPVGENSRKSRQTLPCSDRDAQVSSTAGPFDRVRGLRVGGTDPHQGTSRAAAETHGNVLGLERHGRREQSDCLPMNILHSARKTVLFEELS